MADIFPSCHLSFHFVYAIQKYVDFYIVKFMNPFTASGFYVIELLSHSKIIKVLKFSELLFVLYGFIFFFKIFKSVIYLALLYFVGCKV